MLFQWLAVPLWVLFGKDSVPTDSGGIRVPTDSGGIPLTILRSRNLRTRFSIAIRTALTRIGLASTCSIRRRIAPSV
jgi:hypothetical protein